MMLLRKVILRKDKVCFIERFQYKYAGKLIEFKAEVIA